LPEEGRASAVDFTTRLFGHPIAADQVIEEEFVPHTERSPTSNVTRRIEPGA
jgi:hypothetical protein